MLLKVNHTRLKEFHIGYMTDVWSNPKRNMKHILLSRDFLLRNDIRSLSAGAFQLYLAIVIELVGMRQSSATIESKCCQSVVRVRSNHVQELAARLEWFHIVIVRHEHATCSLPELELEINRTGEEFSTYKEFGNNHDANLKKIEELRLILNSKNRGEEKETH
jgi:hypothetical protein